MTQDEANKALAAIEALATDAIPVVTAINPAYGAMALAANTAMEALITGAQKLEAAYPAAPAANTAVSSTGATNTTKIIVPAGTPAGEARPATNTEQPI